MKTPPQFATVVESQKPMWLSREIPHRICATLTWLEMSGEWKMPIAPALPETGDFHTWCIGRSVDEGRKAALRWLIEFVGIKLKGDNQVVEVEPHPNGKSVTIAQFGGQMMQTSAEGALMVAKAWQACSQSSMHPTTDTGHSDIGPSDLAKALALVIQHLERHLYAPNQMDLWSIVRSQEECRNKDQPEVE